MSTCHTGLATSPVRVPARPKRRQYFVPAVRSAAGRPLVPVTSKLVTSVVHARVVQISTCAPSVPAGSSQWSVGRWDVAVDVESGASWGFFDYRRVRERFEDGFQSLPVDWTISSARKRGFFGLLKEITGS